MRNFFSSKGEDGYNRPHDPWTCGHSESGDPCRLGPSPTGACEGQGECAPVKSGLGHKCNRPAARGGPCEPGPTTEGVCAHARHCTPVRSLRKRRGRWVSSVALLAVGVGCLLWGSPWAKTAIVPGPLTSAHAQILQRTAVEARCATCHPAGNAAPLSWLETAAKHAAVGDHATPSQTDLCVKCHTTLTPAAVAKNPHTLPLDQLPTKPRTRLASLGHSLGLGAPEEVACSRCHQEHHGAEFDLKAMTNARCQACHAEQFNSFAGSHPEFTNWPQAPPPAVAFDHTSHGDKYFPQKQKTFACGECHTETASGGMSTTLGYADTCAECHNASLKASAMSGVALWSAPVIDAEALRAAGAEPGPWPEAAVDEFDGEFPALMKLLLAADPAASAAFDKLGWQINLFDLDLEDPAALRETGALIQASTALLSELKTDSTQAVQRRLSEVVQRTVTAEEAAALVAKVGAQPQAAWEAWFGGTHLDDGGASAWRVDDATMAVRYTPTGHADPLLKAWLEVIAELPPEREELRSAALDELAGAKSPGQCATCHAIDAGPHAIAWQALPATPSSRPFTHFAHGPHLMQPELANCAACHARPTITPVSTAAQRSDFAPLGKTACASCHQPHAAGDSCTQCHNYHVGAQSP